MQLIKRQSMNEWMLRVGVEIEIIARVSRERIMCNNLRACATKWANKIFHFYANIFTYSLFFIL